MSEGRRRAAGGVAPHDWRQYGLAQIWAMLESQSRHHGVIATRAWSVMNRVCAGEADALESALARLRERWPPPQGAAVAFQEWGARLMAAMRGTAVAADRNGRVVDLITEAIDNTRQRVDGLRAEAQEYRGIEEQAGRPAADALFQARYIGGRLPGGMTIAWRYGLDRIAQHMMAELEATIADQHDRIAHDEPYEMLSAVGETPEEFGTEVTSASEAWSSATLGWSVHPPGTVLDSVLASLDPDAGAPGGGGTWPGGGSAPGGGGGSGPGGDGGAETWPAGIPGPNGDWVPAGAPASGSAAGWPGGSPGSSFVDTPAGTVLGPGGVIGGAPGPARAPGFFPGGPAGPGSPARPGGAGVVPMVPPATTGQPGAGGRGSSRRSARRGLRSVFEVPQAPPAVIRPPDQPPVHDPGPGVFGLDR